MKLTLVIVGLFVSLAAGFDLAQGAESGPPPLSPGRYLVNVMPPFNQQMAERIEKQLKNVPGLSAVTAKKGDSSIHFTVKEGAHVEAAQLSKELQTVDGDAVMDTPILDHSLSSNPGL